jgi:hypothetical protein
LEIGSTATAYAPYENICPISGHTQAVVTRTGVNVWDEEWEVGAYASVSGSKVASNDRIRCKNMIHVLPNTTYYFKAPHSNVQMYYYGANGEYLRWETPPVNRVITIPAGTYFIAFNGPANSGTTYNHDISINYPSTDHDYHPYAGQSINIQLGKTVYGGKLDVLSGELVITHEAYTFNGTEAIDINVIGGYNRFSASIFANNTGAHRANGMCSHLTYGFQPVETNAIDLRICCFEGRKYLYWRWDAMENVDSMKAYLAQQYANGTPMIAVAILESPITVTLTPNELSTLLGANNIWSDAGEVTAEYRADPTLFIQRKIAEALS